MPKPVALVVEDNKDIAEIIAESLGECGYEATIAHDGIEGLYFTKKLHPSVVTVDIRMKPMDGASFIHAMRHFLPAAQRTVVVITGHENPIEALSDAPYDHLLGKPFDLDELESVIMGGVV